MVRTLERTENNSVTQQLYSNHALPAGKPTIWKKRLLWIFTLVTYQSSKMPFKQ